MNWSFAFGFKKIWTSQTKNEFLPSGSTRIKSLILATTNSRNSRSRAYCLPISWQRRSQHNNCPRQRCRILREQRCWTNSLESIPTIALHSIPFRISKRWMVISKIGAWLSHMYYMYHQSSNSIPHSRTGLCPSFLFFLAENLVRCIFHRCFPIYMEESKIYSVSKATWKTSFRSYVNQKSKTPWWEETSKQISRMKLSSPTL